MAVFFRLNFSDTEKERLAYSLLKRIRLSEKWYSGLLMSKRRDKKFNNKCILIYGNQFISDFLKQMQEDGILDINSENKRYIVSQKGRELYKRGWLYHERRWYDADYIRKYTFIISLTALFLSIIGTDNLRNFIIYIWKSVCKLW